MRAWQSDPRVRAWLVPINPLPPAPLRFATRVKFLRTIVTELTYIPLLVRELARADVVHVFSASYFSFVLAPLPAILIARALGRPVVLNYHSGEAPDHLKRSALARAVLAHVDRIVVPSPFLESVFRTFALDAVVVPNTIDTTVFGFRERAPLRPKLLSTRNLDYPYNVACTLRAFAVVQRHHPEASLTLIGGGRHDAPLRDLTRQLSLRNVNFVGRVDPSQIAAYYAEHDIYIQSPDIDNMPLSLLEAFSSGLPAVSTDPPGVRAMLRHGDHGLLSPVNDHDALAANVLQLLTNPAAANRMACAARDMCRAYTWEAVAPQWLRVYETALSKRAHALGRVAPTGGDV